MIYYVSVFDYMIVRLCVCVLSDRSPNEKKAKVGSHKSNHR